MITLGLPQDESVLAAIGMVAARHGQLDHVLRMTVKSIAGVSPAEALDATEGDTSWQLREQVFALAKRRLGPCPAMVQLRALLTRAKDASGRRNRLLHGLWAQESDGRDVYLADGQRQTPMLSVGDLEALADELFDVAAALNSARLKGFLYAALEATKPAKPMDAAAEAE
jgi:hypothetical protein